MATQCVSLFDHVPVNQSFCSNATAVFIFVLVTLTSILAPLTSHAIALYYNNNKTY